MEKHFVKPFWPQKDNVILHTMLSIAAVVLTTPAPMPLFDPTPLRINTPEK